MKKLSVVRYSMCLGIAGMLMLGCATESSRVVETPQVRSSVVPYSGQKRTVIVGQFSNRSNYMRGVFSDGVDRLGDQAKTLLITHLQQSGRFAVMDRDHLDETSGEAALAGQEQRLKAARYTITGDVSEFGRKEVGDQQLFGIVGSGRKQIAYSKVSLYVVDVISGEVVYSVHGAGEYELSHREVLGFGGTASYDSTLNGKVLDLAIREAVDALAYGLDSGAWSQE